MTIPLNEIVENYFKDNDLLKNKGTYLEAGAFDGIIQSNTYFLEKLGWTGILVEPSFNNYLKCILNRPNSISINCALVSYEDFQNETFIVGDFDSDIMSSISGSRRALMRKEKYKRTISKLKLPQTYLIDFYKQRRKVENKLPAYTLPLSELLERINYENIDFLSLDVEGYEYQALKGINFKEHKPKLILVEIYKKQFQEIRALLMGNGYEEPINLTNFSRDRNPGWDGLHNDYLFTLKK